MQELKIVDFTREDSSKKINNFRKMISILFSKPVSPHSSEKEYLPTQYLAEYIKCEDFDGVKYRSAVNPLGYNVCIFNPSLMKIKYVKTIDVQGIEVKFE